MLHHVCAEKPSLVAGLGSHKFEAVMIVCNGVGSAGLPSLLESFTSHRADLRSPSDPLRFRVPPVNTRLEKRPSLSRPKIVE